MAGSITLAGQQQFNSLGRPLIGGKVYWIQAGTTSTPQNAFYDIGLTSPVPNYYTLLADGRIPFHYLEDGYIKLRVTDATGTTFFEQDNIPVLGASSGGGGGGGGVDPTTIIATGDIKTRYGTGSLTGFVRLNGRTIGSATSGATERANSDSQALFEYLWLADANLAVSTGRGVSASADWVANKTIALPDGRGRVLAALDDMGNSAAGRLTASYFGTAATVLGAAGGAEKITLARSDLPNTSVTVAITDPGHAHTYTRTNLSSSDNGGPAIASASSQTNTSTGAATTGISAAFNLNGSVTQTFPNVVQPTLLVTNYIKL